MMGQCKPRPRIRVAEAATAASISPSQGTQTAALTHTLQMLEAFEPSARKGWSDAWFQAADWAADWGDRLAQGELKPFCEAPSRGLGSGSGAPTERFSRRPWQGIVVEHWLIKLSRHLAAGVATVARSGSTVKG